MFTIPEISGLTRDLEGFGKIPITNNEQTQLIDKIVTHLEVCYWTKTAYPSKLEVLNRYNLTLTDISQLEDAIDDGLVKRDLPKFSKPINRLEGDFDSRFVTAVNLIVDTMDKRSRAVKLKAVGLTTRRFNAFLLNKQYKDYFQNRVAEMFKETNEIAKVSLSKNVEAGDLQSIKYFWEVTGQHDPNKEITTNLNRLIILFTEILVKYVDPKVIQKVTEEFDTKLLEIDLR